MTSQQQQERPSSSQFLSWRERFGRWFWKIIAFLGILLLLGAVTSLLVVRVGHPRGPIPPDSLPGWLLTPLFPLTGLCLAFLLWIIWLLGRGTPSLQIRSLPDQEDRVRMLRRLRQRYEQMLALSLQQTAPIEIGLASHLAAPQYPTSLSLRLPDQPEQHLSSHTAILQAYEQAQQRLLILGEAGAGKSTQLLELALHLVTQAEHDPAQPLPVILPLTSWAIKRPTLQDWLIKQVSLLYDVPHRISQQWVQASNIFPLLDGLDEVQESARPDCILAINRALTEGLPSFVVCSRTDDYFQAAQRESLWARAVAVVQPLSVEQVDAHLEQLGEPLAALRSALRENPALQELATTPLFLQALSLTYHSTPVPVLPRQQDQLRRQIWADYVQRMMSRQGETTRYPLDLMQQWLSFLARQMQAHHQPVFFLDQLQPDWLPAKERTFYRWSMELVLGLPLGLVYGLFLGLLTERFFGGLVGQLIGWLVGIVIVLTAWWSFGRSSLEMRHVEESSWQFKGIRRALFFGLPGLLFGLLIGLPLSLESGLSTGTFFGQLSATLAWMITIVLDMAGGEHLTERIHYRPNEGIHRSIRQELSMMLFWLLFGLILWQSFGPLPALLFGLCMGLAGLSAAARHYTLRFFLWRSDVFPLRAAPFLEDATTWGLLRRVNWGYSFSHRMLQDYLAELDPQ